jgi:hypothetical protein
MTIQAHPVVSITESMNGKRVRIFWSPKTLSQRAALARHGADWELVPGYIPYIVRGVLCRFIRPVVDVFDNAHARWVRVQQVKIEEIA